MSLCKSYFLPQQLLFANFCGEISNGVLDLFEKVSPGIQVIQSNVEFVFYLRQTQPTNNNYFKFSTSPDYTLQRL